MAFSNAGRGNFAREPTISNIPADNCSCKANSITCHHPGAIWKNATLVGYKEVRGLVGQTMVPTMELKIQPPRPEPTAHLAVLRNPRHPEWKARPANYMSPALCNTSAAYVKRVVESEAREQLINGEDVSSCAAFSLKSVQTRELKLQREKSRQFRNKQKQRKIAHDARAWMQFNNSSHSTSPVLPKAQTPMKRSTPILAKDRGGLVGRVTPSPDCNEDEEGDKNEEEDENEEEEEDEDEDTRLALVRTTSRRPENSIYAYRSEDSSSASVGRETPPTDYDDEEEEDE